MTHLRESGTLTTVRGGNATVTVITPGIGSSGTYPRETIEQAARDRVFHAGLLMFADHDTDEDTWTRPEGSIKNLVGVLAEDAHWDTGSDALVAEVKIFEHWKPLIRDMAETIGVSIRAAGEVEETADGRIVKRLTEARSVDFVTKAGRGGRVMEVLEAARPTTLDEITQIFEAGRMLPVSEAMESEKRERLNAAVHAVHQSTDQYVWVRDYDDTHVYYQLDSPAGMQTYQQAYVEDNGSIRLHGEKTEVIATTSYKPVAQQTSQPPAGQEESSNPKELPMGHIQIEEADHKVLVEKASRVDALETQLAEADSNGGGSGGGGGGRNATSELERLRAENKELKAEIAELKRQNRTSEAAKIIGDTFTESGVTAPSVIADLTESVVTAELDDDAINEKAKAYAAELAPTGGVTHFGESRPAHTPTQPADESVTYDDLVAVKGA